jgi:glycosyltransferase involved in cell wall biosynthesis
VRIALDIRRMTEFGIGTYIRNVVRALGRLDRTTKYFLIGSPEKVKESGPLPANFHTVPLLEADTTAKGYFEFRTILKRLDVDLVHIPQLFWMPRSLPCPYVMTVHDVLEHMSRSKGHSGLRRSVHYQLTRRVLLGAARIFAVSQFSKSEVEKLFGIQSQKIEVDYNEIDESLLHGHANDADRQLIAERYLVTYPFLLYAGRISPHKNLVRIIEAFSALKGELEKEDRLPDLKLIIIGDDLSGHPDLRRTVIRSGVNNDVRFFGFVPIDILRIFYDLAIAFLFPSLYEGFGLPPLEAMAHGTPVITSNTSSLPEVMGKAAVLVNPENVFEIMRATHRVLVDPALREKLKLRGYERSKHFSWDESARRILKVYREVAGAPDNDDIPSDHQPEIPRLRA